MSDIKEIHEKYESLIGKEIKINGWVRSVRDSKSLAFINLNDGTSFDGIQVVANESEITNYAEVVSVGTGGSLNIVGTLVESKGKGQKYEVKATSIAVLGTSPEDYPLQKKGHSMEFLRTIAHIRPKTNTFMAVFRIRSLAGFAIHDFFNKRGFVNVHSPILTSMDAEGAGEMFKVTTNNGGKPEEDFFGKEAFLTVTGQLQAEAFAQAFNKVYTFGPTFRSENSNTTRHAAEFWMIEPEIAFAELPEVIELAEAMVKHVLSYVVENAKAELEFLNQHVDKGLLDRLDNVINSPFGVVTYTEAIEILKKADVKFEYDIEWGADLQTEHERYLAEVVYKKPVFVTNYPKEIKAFYMRLDEDGKTVAATDLLVPGIGELIGGSQREERFDVLEAKIKELGLDPSLYSWYLDLRKYGTVKHGGFGLGFERLIMYLTGIGNIRDAIPFPRTVNNLEF